MSARTAAERIPVFDLNAQYAALKPELDEAVARVLASGWFIQGQEHAAFEREFAEYSEVAHGVGVASGTDAIRIALQALGVERGDEVITVANAGMPPIVAVREVGATPVFVDVDPRTRNLDPARLVAAITPKTRAVLAVHLFGHPADVDAILDVVRPRGIKLVEDCAQAHGARYRGRRVGSLGDAAAFSFYPTKNLGAYGDGGFVATNDPDVADRARLLRGYGWRQRYLSESHGINSRLDELQAAVLRVKLRHLDAANEERQRRARLYDEALRGVATPVEQPWAEAVYHLYVIESERRDALKAALNDASIATDVHYPLPSHLQPATADLGYAVGSLPETERLAAQVLSLPMYPELPIKHVERVAGHVGRIARELAGKPR
ncbi:MAG: DegT/DnrJ/EryC1/StrS family aminotransferase [Chloroflexota bacterium]|nr:DegT/DnrJ/EryC1/StrS family aminotransferase [Chloroflexota bacterium]